MNTNKYYNWKKNLPLNSNLDICEYSVWEKSSNNYLGALHEDGFLVFLKPDEINKYDSLHDDPLNIHDSYISSSFHRDRMRTTIQIIKKIQNKLGDKLKILDIGCGKGFITSEIKSIFSNFEVSAIDCSISAIQYCVKEYKNIDFILMDAKFPVFASNYFDILIFNNIWEHLLHPLIILKKLSKSLKPNSYVIISTPNRYHAANLLKVLLGRKITIQPKHVTEYSVQQMIEQLSFVNFDIVRILSNTIKYDEFNFRKFFIWRIFKPLLSTYAKSLKSTQVFNQTVFFLAQKK